MRDTFDKNHKKVQIMQTHCTITDPEHRLKFACSIQDHVLHFVSICYSCHNYNFLCLACFVKEVFLTMYEFDIFCYLVGKRQKDNTNNYRISLTGSRPLNRPRP